MKIDKDHLYHGAALLQIAEHPKFTAINSLEISGRRSRSAYLVNESIGVFLKYASEPSKNGEYKFTFAEDHVEELGEIAGRVTVVFVALMCVEEREIACLSLAQLAQLVEWRWEDAGGDEQQYVLCVAAPPRKKLRVYVKAAGRKGAIVGNALRIGRRDFPNALFA